MYAVQRKKATGNPSSSRAKKPSHNTPPKHYPRYFDEVRSKPLPFEQNMNEPVIQRVLKMTDSPGETPYQFKIDDIESILDEVYYGELEHITSKDKVRAKIEELIQGEEEISFSEFWELKDRLCEYFSGQMPDEPLSDAPAEEMPQGYKGILHEHPLYHDVIKKRIIKTITKKRLQSLLKRKGQTNFDFYIRGGRKIYVSDNDSKKAEIYTGYDIIFHSKNEFEIVQVDVSDETAE